MSDEPLPHSSLGMIGSKMQFVTDRLFPEAARRDRHTGRLRSLNTGRFLSEKSHHVVLQSRANDDYFVTGTWTDEERARFFGSDR